MNTPSLLSSLIVVLVVLVVIGLIGREIFCWYWKINERKALLAEIRDLLKKQPH